MFDDINKAIEYIESKRSKRTIEQFKDEYLYKIVKDISSKLDSITNNELLDEIIKLAMEK